MIYPTFTHNSRCITPQMTSNTAPSPVVISASSVYGDYPDYQPWKAFTRVVNASTDLGWSANGTSNQWIQVDLGAGNLASIDSYTITARGDLFPSDFKSWYLYAGVNSYGEAVIDTRLNVPRRTWNLDYGAEMVTFTLPGGPSPLYRYFRFYIPGVGTWDGYAPGVGEIQLLRSITGTPNHLGRRTRDRSMMRPGFRL